MRLKDITDIQCANIIEYYLSNNSTRKTAKQFNISQTFVVKILKKFNIKKESKNSKSKQYATEWRNNHGHGIDYRFKHGKGNAKYRGIDFNLSLDEYMKIISNKCYYCDDKLGSTTNTSGFSIDRLNNDIGYTKDNCVSCCGFCNKVRMHQLTPEQTKAAIRAIIIHNSSYEEDSHIW